MRAARTVLCGVASESRRRRPRAEGSHPQSGQGGGGQMECPSWPIYNQQSVILPDMFIQRYQWQPQENSATTTEKYILTACRLAVSRCLGRSGYAPTTQARA